MSSELICEPCALKHKTTTAVKFCSDCEEHLCDECVESHLSFKAFRLHHIVNIQLIKSKFPTPNKHCEIHSEVLLEFFCTQHDTTCCRVCIADSHRSCEKIIPLDIAAKDIKTSFLTQESLSSITDILTALENLLKNREDSLEALKEAKTKAAEQISSAKFKLIQLLDEAEEILNAKVLKIEKENEDEILEQKDQLSQLKESCEKTKEELMFLKEHGSNTQLFLTIRQTIKSIAKTDDEMKQLSSVFTNTVIEFQQIEDNKAIQIGSVSEIKKPCKVELAQRVLQQAQTETNVIKSLREFDIECYVPLKSGEHYYIPDMDITHDNKLLVSNYSPSHGKLYIYKDCTQYENEISLPSSPYGVSVIPDTDTAVVTLSCEYSIQFINTTKLTKGDKIKIGIFGYSVTATRNRIFVGGRGVVKILDSKGSSVNSVKVGNTDINSLCYDKDNANILCRSNKYLIGCKEDGTVLYQYGVSGDEGLAVDNQGNVYVSMWETKEIHRLTSDGKFIDDVSTNGNPGVLRFNNDYSKLFVVLDNSKIIIYRCK